MFLVFFAFDLRYARSAQTVILQQRLNFAVRDHGLGTRSSRLFNRFLYDSTHRVLAFRYSL